MQISSELRERTPLSDLCDEITGKAGEVLPQFLS
jgi:hypothetical protein